MPRTRVKICGVRDLDTALAAADAGADAVGFVFHPASPRFIEPAAAAEVMCGLPPMLATVGLFVNVSLDRFCDIEEECPTTLVQFHGNEPESLVRQCGPNLIKAIRFDAATIAADLAKWSSINEVDAILVDGSSGGQGTPFDWPGLGHAIGTLSTPIILAGGLTPGNVAEAIRTVRPYAVDVSSGVETAPGVKDPVLIEAFCRAVAAADLSD